MVYMTDILSHSHAPNIVLSLPGDRDLHCSDCGWRNVLFCHLTEPDSREAEPASPDYVPGPEYPKQAPPSPDYVPGLEYVADSDPGEDSEDGPIDYPADGGDDCNTPKIGSQRNVFPGALLHNTIAQVMRERPLNVV
ncbi:hypothetical protein Tco_1299969 [Tanacetum coccineum]